MERLRTEPASPPLHVGHHIHLRLESSSAGIKDLLRSILCVTL